VKSNSSYTFLSFDPIIERSFLKYFIDVPKNLYAQEKYYISPLDTQLYDLFHPKHPFFEQARTRAFVCLEKQTGRPLGRLLAIDNKAYRRFHNAAHLGHFGFFDCPNDPYIANSLFEMAYTHFWKERQLHTIQGPFNPSTNYECGQLVEGFDSSAYLMMPYAPEYISQLLESAVGMKKIKDLLAYTLPVTTTLPELIKRMSERSQKAHHISYRTFNPKKFEEEIRHMFEIYNSAWEENWGFVPMTWREFKHTAKDLKMILDPNLILFAKVREEYAGFLVGLPDLNQILKYNPSGNLLKFLWFFLTKKKTIDRFRILTLGIKKEYRHLGLAGLLYTKIQEQAFLRPYQEAEMSWILEDNSAMNRPLELMGAYISKRYRLYTKDFEK